MPLRIAEDAPLPERSSSKSMTDSERKASGTRSGDIERLWHRPFLAKARKQRLGDPSRQPQRSENTTTVEVVSGKRRRGNPLEEIHGPGSVAGSSSGGLRSRPSQRSRLMPSKRLERHAEKAYEPDGTTDHFSQRVEEVLGSSSDENTQMDARSLATPHSVRHHTRKHANASTSERKRIRDLEKVLGFRNPPCTRTKPLLGT